MAGLRGSQAYWMASKQSAKGTPPTKWEDGFFFTDGNINPTKETDQLSETDNNRNAGDFFATQTGVEGSPSAYVRDPSIHHLLEYALGAATHEGTTNFTHKISSAASVPYVTFAKMLGGTLYEQFNDCKVDELSLAWATGQPGTVGLSIMGRSAQRLAAVWTAENEEGVKGAIVEPSTVAPLNFNNAKVTLEGGETHLVSSFELTISNNLTVQQTDDSIPYDVVEGTLEVTWGFDLIIESLKQYNLFNYGAEAGKTQSPNIFTTTNITFEFERTANNFLKLVIPTGTYTAVPVEPDAGGAPVVAAVTGASQRDANGFLQATVKNQVEK